MKSVLIAVVFAIAVASEGSAQASPAGSNTVVPSLRRQWQTVTGYITKAADQMPEADYAFRPTTTVRTFAQLIGHLAGAQNMICGSALGQTNPPAEDAVEKSATTKAQLVAALRASTEFCAKAYAQADAETHGATKLFGNDATRLDALVANTVHNAEHYGNIVTYLRVKGMVPPSSQPQPR